MKRAIKEYEALYRETRNPLYAWEAMARSRRGEPLPDWLWDYFVGAARSMHALGQPAWDDVPPDRIGSRHLGLLDLADRVAGEQMTGRGAIELLARALGLQRGANFNAFAALALDRRAFGDAWHVDVKRAGTKQDAALFEIERQYSKSTGQPGDSFGRQIKRRIKRARELWRAQRE